MLPCLINYQFHPSIDPPTERLEVRLLLNVRITIRFNKVVVFVILIIT